MFATTRPVLAPTTTSAGRTRRPLTGVTLVALVLALLVPGALPASAEPTLNLDPGFGSVGTEVGVSGGGYERFIDEARVDVLDDDGEVAHALGTVDLDRDSGRILPDQSVRMRPRAGEGDLEPGLRDVRACAAFGGDGECAEPVVVEGIATASAREPKEAFARFRVLAIDADPQRGEPGDTIEVAVDGFADPAACGPVTLEIGGDDVLTATPTGADERFGFTRSITLPEDLAAGRQELTARQWQRGCGLSVSTTIRVATLEVVPSAGAPGSTATVDGAGFGLAFDRAGGCDPVRLTFDGIEVGSAEPQGGAFSEDVTVPDLAPGTSTVVAEQRRSAPACNRATVTFTVIDPDLEIDPSLEVDPQEATIEEEIEATGADFEPALEVELRIGEIDLATVPAGDVDDGTFAVPFELPEGVPGGEQEVVACQRCDADDEVAATATLRVLPRIFLDRDLAARGELVAVTGDGFPTEQPAVLSWSQGIGRQTVTADERGELRVSVLIFRRDLLGPRQLVVELSDEQPEEDEEPLPLTEDLLVVPGTVSPPDFTGRR